MNLFISVVIDNFNEQKRKFEVHGGEMFLTDLQKQLHRSLKRLKSAAPQKLLICPSNFIRGTLFRIVQTEYFEIITLSVTIINLIFLALETDIVENGYLTRHQVDNINYAFLGLFTIEVLGRLIALGKSYTYQWINCLDAVLVTLSLILETGLILSARIKSLNFLTDSRYSNYFSLWLPMLKLLRAIRILRVARVATGIRTLVFAFMLSLPALTNVLELLVLIMFIYSIFGMNLFAFLKKSAGINEVLNFETFPSSFLLLFEVSTSAGWDTFLEPMLYEDEPFCNPDKFIDGTQLTNCGSPTIGKIFIISYLVITFIIVTNMYIAIIFKIKTSFNFQTFGRLADLVVLN